MECFLLVVIGWVFSVCIHEFAHAWVAQKGGDYTVVEKGYLTLNPFRYAHPVYSVLMPVLFLMLGGIGLPGGAVYINHSLLRSRGWEMAVALAGPAANVILVGVLSLGFWTGLIPSDPNNLLSVSLAFLLHLELCAILLNLLPVPPLDGFQAIAPWLPPHIRQGALNLAGPAQLILLVLLWNQNIFQQTFWQVILIVSWLAGAEPTLVYQGYKEFAFWRH